MGKGRRDKHGASFVALDRHLIVRCPEFRQLSPAAVTLYIYLKAKFNGANNGQIRFHYSELKGVKGFGSKETISRTFRELESKGWIKRTRIGGMYRYQNEYQLTGQFDDRV
jgi:hypothetical protein